MVIRHDTDPARYLAAEKDYPAIFQLKPAAGVATLVASHWAVTAAHCVYLLIKDDFEEIPFRVTIAGVENVVTEAIYPAECQGLDSVKAIFAKARTAGESATSVPVIDEAYGALGTLDLTHDVALLKLEQPVKHVKPLAIYEQSNELGQNIVMLGWGAFAAGDKGIIQGQENYDGIFRQTHNRIDSVSVATFSFDFDAPGSSATLPLEGVSGPGDSGGPALVRTVSGLEVAGVSSHSSYDSPETNAQVEAGELPIQLYGTTEHYTRLSTRTRWINSIITS